MRLPPIRIRVDDAPLAALYGDREPFHWVTNEGATSEALSGVSVFGNDVGPHWHYVGFGLAPEFGFELSFRLAADRIGDGAPAPAWPVKLLDAFARHAIRSGRPFECGHYLCLPEPVDPHGAVRCAAVVSDPQLRDADPQWLQIVGLHEDELDRMSGDGYRRFLEELRRRDPLLVTALDRNPLERTR